MSYKIENGFNKNSEENFIITNPTHYIPNEKGMGYAYFEAMKKHRNNVAQYISVSDEKVTYSELLEICIKVSLNLRDQYNLERDDIIMLCTNNHKNSCVPFIASVFLGIQVASLDPSLSRLDMVHYLKEVEPRILFVIPEVLEVVEESLSETGIASDIIIFGNTDKYKTFNDFLKPHEDEETFVPVPVNSLEDPVVIVFSSGTTGSPKGIVLNHYALGAQSYNVIQLGSMRLVYLIYSTLFWITGVLALSASLVRGSTSVICSKYDPKRIWHIIDKYKVISTFLAPSQIVAMLENGRPETVDTSSLKVLITGGCSVSETLIKNLRKLLPGTLVYQTYGLTEVVATATAFNTYNAEDCKLLWDKTNSIGPPLPGLNLKVVDPETEVVCGPYQQGELRIKSRIMMNGYYKRDSVDAFDSNGWLKTGDIVYYDEDNCFYVVDRIKTMLKYKSFQISPAIIEKILLDHPAVQQAVVIGVPDPVGGDHPMAIVVLSNKYKNNVTEKDIESFVAGNVSDRMKLRGGVKFVDSIPITASGKVKREKLRKAILEE